MCGSMVDIQSATAEIRREKKKNRRRRRRRRRRRNHRAKIMSASATQGGHNNARRTSKQSTFCPYAAYAEYWSSKHCARCLNRAIDTSPHHGRSTPDWSYSRPVITSNKKLSCRTQNLQGTPYHSKIFDVIDGPGTAIGPLCMSVCVHKTTLN